MAKVTFKARRQKYHTREVRPQGERGISLEIMLPDALAQNPERAEAVVREILQRVSLNYTERGTFGNHRLYGEVSS